MGVGRVLAEEESVGWKGDDSPLCDFINLILER